MACCGTRPPGAHPTLQYALVWGGDGDEKIFESYEAAYLAQIGFPGSRMVARERRAS
jgi:hypothetical protein